jgi:deoxyribodipyrimidine photo-lyase
MDKNAIVLFSDDFRTIDNPALFHASNKFHIIPLFIYDENYTGRKTGSASEIFLKNAVGSFGQLLWDEYRLRLIIRRGKVLEELKKIVSEVDIKAIFFSKSYTETQIKTHGEIASYFTEIEVQSFNSKTIFEPSEIKNKAGSDFQIFTHFKNTCLSKSSSIATLPEPEKIIPAKHDIQSHHIGDVFPSGNEDTKGISKWNFNHQELHRSFGKFLKEKINSYQHNRDFPAIKGTSHLSPYLRFGMISPKLCFQLALKHSSDNVFASELLWRDFAHYTALHHPQMHAKEIKPLFKNFQWNTNAEFFSKWKRGGTGFDIVDAGMRELYETGQMHNRVRMIAASFLIKDLLIDWRDGERWFWENLIDACPAINPFSWQWVGGTGMDASPYYRIFNPELQVERFDKNRTYCNTWNKSKTPVNKIVNHALQRAKSLAIYKQLQYNKRSDN